MGSYVLLVASVSLAVIGQILMKQGMRVFGAFPFAELPQKLVPMLLNPFVFFGLAVFGVSAVLWLAVLSRLDLSFVYPLVSVGYIIVALFSWLVFKENVTFIRWAGIFTICLGVFFISRS